MGSTLPIPVPERKSHPYLTYDMIHEIPDAIRATLNNDRIVPIADKLTDRRSLYFTGCGTAFFSAMLGAESLRLSMIRSLTIPALELQSYGYPIDKLTGIVAVSHSGITKTTVDALRYARSKGAFGVGITHFKNRPISDAADETILVGNSPDNSKCHTKCYVAGAVAIAKISSELLKESGEIESGLQELPDLTSKVAQSTDEVCERFAEMHCKKTRYYIAGTGSNVPNTAEAALKIMETSYVSSQGFETEQLLHGPWASLDKDTLLIVLAPRDSCYRRNYDLVKAAQSLGAGVIAMVEEGDNEIRSISDTVELPASAPSIFPYLNIIPLYFIAYYLSVKRGANPDMLRYLAPLYWQARNIIFPPGTH